MSRRVEVFNMIWWLSVMSDIICHELAHILVAWNRGARWKGIHVRWTRIAVVIDVTDVSIADQRRIARAGIIVDGAGWIMWIVDALYQMRITPAIGMGIVWFSLLISLNASPWIPGSDGWQLRHLSSIADEGVRA
ncbi:MAG: hypothetical protein C7B47_17850 [Sulfobacillus thermosulfidooxidans]|uniref:Peptidase M50 domain-containing protein n=1 Tax=Sulfobacillus thermosulfidooxidans TaxID=28034 RepID=A0A2T2WEL2_SULTH|nr:MAG: hypothetical protein C7B47_17850 [Sulfobacillus thermosulfidooxidans]